MVYELIIIGAGPAGITASVYAARKRLDFLVISKDVGGQAAWSGEVENYTGYQFISGAELALKFEEHMRSNNVQLKQEEVVGLEAGDKSIYVNTSQSRYEAKAVVVASGTRSKELNVPGEKEFKNKGLTYCATCDGPLFRDKDVAVIGGGNSSLDAAIQLIKIARHIYIINVNSELAGDAVMQETVTKDQKVTILNNSQVTSVAGGRFVESISIKTNDKESSLGVQGVFVEIGLIPNSQFVKILKKNNKGEIEINAFNETSLPGVFAAGDVTDVSEKQIVIAAGEGAKAVLSAFRYLVRGK